MKRRQIRKKQRQITAEKCTAKMEKALEKKSQFYKKNWQVTHIAPLQPPALATFLSWGIQQELAV